MRLLTRTAENAKLAKASLTMYEIVSLFLHPSITICPWASKHCLAACLNTSGLASVFPKILEARKAKTKLFQDNPTAFLAILKKELAREEKRAHKKGKKLAFRPNGTSDLDELTTLADSFPSIAMYDYTKSIDRVRRYAEGKLPKNYHLTFSFSGENESEAREALRLGVNVAVVFETDKFPAEFWGYPVINGDVTDLRFLDKRGAIVGLKAKGKAKKKSSPFVIPVTSLKTT